MNGVFIYFENKKTVLAGIWGLGMVPLQDTEVGASHLTVKQPIVKVLIETEKNAFVH